MEGLLIPAANFSVQNFIGSRLKLSAAWAVSFADLHHRNIGLLFTIKILCQIPVPFFQDSSFNWGLKRKIHSIFFSFLVPHMHIFNKLYKKQLVTFNIKNQILNHWTSCGCASFDLNSKIPLRKLWDVWQKAFVTLSRFCPLTNLPTPCS